MGCLLFFPLFSARNEGSGGCIYCLEAGRAGRRAMGGGETVVTLLGDRMVHIENYRGILQYSDSYIRILARQGQICISGKNFCICYYDRDEMKLTGRFDSLRLESGGRRGDA